MSSDTVVPSRFGSWLIVFASALSILSVTGTMYSFAIIYEIISVDENWSSAALSFVGTMEFAIYAIVSSPAGLICDLIGARKTMIIVGIIGPLGIFCSAFVTNVWVLLFTYSFCFGIANSFLLIAYCTIVAEYFVEKRVIATSMGFATIGLGTIFVSQFMVSMAENLSWRTGFKWLSLIQILTCFFAAYSYKPRVSPHSIEGREHSFSLEKLYDLSPLKNKSFLIMCIGSIFIGFAYYISFLYGIVFAIEEKGYSLSDGALFMTIIGASDTISRLILSHFTEGTKKWRFAGFTASIFLLFIMFVFLPFLCDWFESSTLWILYSFYALFGIFYSTLECLEPVIIADIVSLGNFSRAYGLYITFQSLGYISSSWIASDLQNSFGVNSVLIFIGSMFAISGALMIYAECLDIHHHHHHQKPETSQSQLSIQLNTLES